MPIPRLYILHPPESRLPGITRWLAAAEVKAASIAAWDGCRFVRIEYDVNAAFDVATVSDLVRRELGPVLLVEKVQQRLRQKFEAVLRERVFVHCSPVARAEDLWTLLKTVREAHEDGLPRIPLREAIAYLILRKLAVQDKWAGEAKNKSFLWSHDLPNGGFPKDLCGARDIINVADRLANAGILVTKKSGRELKYGLGDKKTVQPILDSRSFQSRPDLRKYFERDLTRVSCRILDQH